MPLSEEQRQKLKELELKRGGVAFAREKTSVTPVPTVIISLGGLGAKTLNMLKGKFSRQIGSSNHVYFRMVDTDEKEFAQVRKLRTDGSRNPNGELETEETISLYDPAITNILQSANMPPYIRSWLNPQLTGRVIQSNGAQQTRQIGRAMLVNSISYNNIRANLTTVINAAIAQANRNGTNVDVLILAGVSGGTGSGTIIDFPYMVHDIFAAAGCTNYRIAGYIYTPDVQFTVPEIATNQMIINNLKNNGYSALKEIDYFMNIEETNSVYDLPTANRHVISGRNIFDSCTLISGYNQNGGTNQPNVTLGRLTDHLMDMLTDIQITRNGVATQMSSSILNNQNAMLTAWLADHESRRLYHRYASYKYQVLGYNSIIIPREEILAYCVNKIYEAVLEEFQNFKLLNKEVMNAVYKMTNITTPDIFLNHAMQIDKNAQITREIALDGYTRRMIRDDNNVAYTDACQDANTIAQRINANYQSRLERDLFEGLKSQIDQIFKKYGPYVAMKAIEHRKNEEGVGDPKEPFSGIVELLERMSNYFLRQANIAGMSYQQGGREQILQRATEACRGLIPDQNNIKQYVSFCCAQAVTDRIDPVLFQTLSAALNNVAVKMNDYNTELFEVYTAILTEVQNTLNRDGQYFTKGVRTDEGTRQTFAIDIIKSGATQTDQLQSYLNDFISHVSVNQLAQKFIEKMRDNKKKWLAQNTRDGFDAVSEVRELMDECLIQNNMQTDIIEKFIVAAYNDRNLTATEIENAWSDNKPGGMKMQALTSASNAIYQELTSGAQLMANSSEITADGYPKNYYISILKDTPQLTNILNQRIQTVNGTEAAISDSRDRFIITQQYTALPMYILHGMDKYNEQYVQHPSVGRHMDENQQDWTRFQNPYTIDQVALDLERDGRAEQEIENYRDYQILLDVQKKTLDGLNKYKFIELRRVNAGGTPDLFLNEVTVTPQDMAGFEEHLYQAAMENADLDVQAFMRANGFIINPVQVAKGQMDIDFSIQSFENLNDPEGNYQRVPVPIPDIYKWLRKSTKYMDILDKDTKIFEELYQVLQQVEKDRAEEQRRLEEEQRQKRKYRYTVETLAFALRTGLVSQDDQNPNIWNYEDAGNPVSVNFAVFRGFDKKYYLYHVWTSLYELSDASLKDMHDRAEGIILKNEEKDISSIRDHVRNTIEALQANNNRINTEAEEQAVTEHYTLTDQTNLPVNPYQVLKRFYSLLNANMA